MQRISILTEDLAPSEMDETVMLHELAVAIGEMMGGCKVVDNVVYYLMEEFEIYTDDDNTVEIPYGVYFIIEVTSEAITVYNSILETCQDVDEIGAKPLSYFTGDNPSVFRKYSSLEEFANGLDDYFGRGWFDDGFDDEEARGDFFSAFKDIINKSSTNEDLQATGDYVGYTFDDIYDELGHNMFSDENIPLLKEAGIIGEGGYPIRDGDSMELTDLYAYDTGFIECPYIRKLLFEELRKEFQSRTGGDFTITYTSYDIPSDIGDYGRDFLVACFEGDCWRFVNFSDAGLSLSRSEEDYIEMIPDSILDDLEKRGLPRTIFFQLADDEADEDAPYANLYDTLRDIFRHALIFGWEAGSGSAYVNEFNEKFNDAAINIGGTAQTLDETNRSITIRPASVEANIDDIWYMFDYKSNSMDCFKAWVETEVTQYLGDNLNFDYKDDFDEEEFKLSLEDEYAENIGFLDTKEVKEDLDAEALPSLEAVPKSELDKVHPRLLTYNEEISKDAVYLDAARVLQLHEWAENHSRSMTSSIERFIDIDDIMLGEFEKHSFILSRIKPKYHNTYLGYDFSIWHTANEMDAYYVGALSYSIGWSLLRGNLSADEKW